MSRLPAITGEKAQERTITITMYAAGHDVAVVEELMIDFRFTANRFSADEQRPVGLFHHEKDRRYRWRTH